MFTIRQTAQFSQWLVALEVIVLLGGGDKRTQAADIKRAQRLAEDL